MSNRFYKKGRRRGAIIKKTSRRSEDQEQQSLILRIKKEYPYLLILGDIAGAKLSKRSAQQAYDCRTGKGMPDIYIFKSCNFYDGLAIELKKSNTKILLKDGSISKKEHIEHQHCMLTRFKDEGWLTGFCVGELDAYETIKSYLNEEDQFPHLIQPTHSMSYVRMKSDLPS